MFKDNKEGSTHFYGDGCPEHPLSDALIREEIAEIISKHVNSEISRSKLPRGVGVRDGGRQMCEYLVVDRIIKTLKEWAKEGDDMQKQDAPKEKDWEKEFDSIFTINFFSSENYKGQVDEYEFTRWQREQTNNANLRVVALKSFISQALEAQKKEIAQKLTLLCARHATWRPTEGYGSEEELGYQKGIQAEAKLFAHDILSLISKDNEKETQ